MGWDVDKLHYIYKVGTLRAIAKCYCSLYNQEYFHPQADLFAIAEYKADFDLALSAIGKGHWIGLENTDFRAYRYFGKAQQVVIADIIEEILSPFDSQQITFMNKSLIIAN